MEEYDFDKRFPVWGFGGIPRFTGATGVSHCFPLTPDGSEVMGTRGILDAYRFSIQNAGLYGPTLFTPLLDAMYQQVLATQSAQVYHILLILTDGAIMDMPTTKARIVSLSEHPISIIIVGLGKADFSKMNELDSDGALLRDNNGRAAKRDIVQFVEFNKYMHAPSALAEEVLREVPDQLVGFMQQHNIPPKKTQQLLPKGTIPPSMLAGFVPPPDPVAPGPVMDPPPMMAPPSQSATLAVPSYGPPAGGHHGSFSHPASQGTVVLPPHHGSFSGDPSSVGYVPPPPTNP